MMTLGQARRKNAKAGEPIFMPFNALLASNTHIRRGQLCMIAAGPGTGKSAFIQAILQRGDDTPPNDSFSSFPGKASTLYFSADSDSATMWKRSAAIATGYEQSNIDLMMQDNDTSAIDDRVRKAAAHMRFDFNSNPTDQHVLDQLEVYGSIYGSYPDVIVMDNLKNLTVDGAYEGEFGMLEGACVFMKDLASDTGAAVIVLHHVVGEHEDGTKPIPLSGIRGKVTKTPEVVLSLYRKDGNIMVSVVKNRNGVMDPSGKWSLPIAVDMNTMQFNG